MDPAFHSLVEEVVVAYRHYWTALLQLAEPIWSQLDLTILQLKGLILLEVREEMTVGAIAQGLGIGRPSASILVEQLVQLGLVTRTEDDADRRRSLVCLSDEGREFTARLHRRDEQYMETIFQQMNADDLVSVKHGLEALARAFMTANVTEE